MYCPWSILFLLFFWTLISVCYTSALCPYFSSFLLYFPFFSSMWHSGRFFLTYFQFTNSLFSWVWPETIHHIFNFGFYNFFSFRIPFWNLFSNYYSTFYSFKLYIKHLNLNELWFKNQRTWNTFLALFPTTSFSKLFKKVLYCYYIH